MKVTRRLILSVVGLLVFTVNVSCMEVTIPSEGPVQVDIGFSDKDSEQLRKADELSAFLPC